MFYNQEKIYYIDKENEEVIVSFKGYNLIFEIIGYKGDSEYLMIEKQIQLTGI